MKKRTGLIAAGIACVLVAAGGTAYAASSSIPSSGGIIYVCYDNGGNMALINPSVTTTCNKGWNGPLQLNEQGQAGAPGQGATVTKLAVGDSHCANGGAAITDGNGNTAYACNGAPGQNGQNGQNGTDGTDGTNGISAPPEFKWTFTCTNGVVFGNEYCSGSSSSSIPAGTVLTPVSGQIGGNEGFCGAIDPFFGSITDNAGTTLATINDDGSMTMSGDDAISSTNAGTLQYNIGDECSDNPFTVTFTFDETQPQSFS
jgi:hypothetical protein